MESDGASAVEGVRERKLGMHEFKAVAPERQVAKCRRGDSQGMYG
jgi:hypothetical protein